MYIINVIALVWFIVSLSLLVAGANTSEERTMMSGAVLLICWLVCGAAFQAGALWQHFDTLQNYTLTKIIKP
jgi:hypothetical protein